jgi:RNA polymerase sigma-70 factor (ECF subfamily)
MTRDPARPKQNDDVERDYRERRASLRAIASRFGEGDSEDIVQDAFVKTMVAQREQRLRSGFAFLLTVTRNAVIDRLRRKSYRENIVESVGDAITEVADGAPSPERAAIAADRLRRTLAIIETMPPRRREVLLLHRIESATYRQISERLMISVKTVENHLAAAMAQLARELDSQDDDTN